MALFKKKSQKQKSTEFVSGTGASAKTLHKNLGFVATEQYKLIRANLDFTLPDEESCPVIGVTSSMRGEGKSTTSINLSYVLAETGKRVLLIDGDLRLPSVARKLDLKSSPGIADLLREKGVQTFEFQSLLLDNWFVLPSGSIPPNPSELLGSNKMSDILGKLKKMFDYIVIDLPPVNVVSDAVSISSLITGMVVVVREDFTTKKELKSCLRQLELSNVKILGCVINQSKFGSSSYGRYKYRYRYRYGYQYGYGSHGYGYGYGHRTGAANTAGTADTAGTTASGSKK